MAFLFFCLYLLPLFIFFQSLYKTKLKHIEVKILILNTNSTAVKTICTKL